MPVTIILSPSNQGHHNGYHRRIQHPFNYRNQNQHAVLLVEQNHRVNSTSERAFKTAGGIGMVGLSSLLGFCTLLSGTVTIALAGSGAIFPAVVGAGITYGCGLAAYKSGKCAYKLFKSAFGD